VVVSVLTLNSTITSSVSLVSLTAHFEEESKQNQLQLDALRSKSLKITPKPSSSMPGFAHRFLEWDDDTLSSFVRAVPTSVGALVAPTILRPLRQLIKLDNTFYDFSLTYYSCPFIELRFVHF
jgi:hypothetical protein